MSENATPWHDDDHIYFELRTHEFEVFDGGNSGALYSVLNFTPGLYRIPYEAIRKATGKDRRSNPERLFEIDSCQMFFVDRSIATKFRELLDDKQSLWPNYAYFSGLRRALKNDFGFAVVTADGTYALDVAHIERVLLGKKKHPKNTKSDLYAKVARRMHTFVCERCFEEELMESDGGPKQLAKFAQEQGWQCVPAGGERESKFFDEFEVVGPKCASAAAIR